jgi:cytoskeleton protein RodZ
MASFGEKLRHERELRGITLREIAEVTKISVRFLQALEDDRFEALPGGLFPRAFVRQYAGFLGLDPTALADEFAAAHAETSVEQRPAAPTERRLRISSGHLILGGIALLLVALSLRRPAPQAEVRPRPGATPAAAPAVLATDRVYPSPPRARETGVSEADVLVLTMTAQQDCWVEARTDGTTVVNRVLAEGESQTLEARGEIVLSVGNAGGLRLRLNDRPTLPLGRSGEVRKNIVITHRNLSTLVDEKRAVASDGRSG